MSAYAGADIPWDEIHKQLSARFPEADIKSKPGPKNKTTGEIMFYLSFIDARDAEDRLDAVVGPANWSDDYEPFGDERHHAVLCHLTIYGVTKSGVGYPNGDNDAEPYKSAESDALKRAGVKFGIGRFLYDEKPQRNGQRRPNPPATPPQRPPANHGGMVAQDGDFGPSPQPQQNHGIPATEKQLAYIARLSVQLGQPENPQPGDYTKDLASARIEELNAAMRERQGGQQ